MIHYATLFCSPQSIFKSCQLPQWQCLAFLRLPIAFASSWKVSLITFGSKMKYIEVVASLEDVLLWKRRVTRDGKVSEVWAWRTRKTIIVEIIDNHQNKKNGKAHRFIIIITD